MDEQGLQKYVLAWIIVKTEDGKTAATAEIDEGGEYFRDRARKYGWRRHIWIKYINIEDFVPETDFYSVREQIISYIIQHYPGLPGIVVGVRFDRWGGMRDNLETELQMFGNLGFKGEEGWTDYRSDGYKSIKLSLLELRLEAKTADAATQTAGDLDTSKAKALDEPFEPSLQHRAG